MIPADPALVAPAPLPAAPPVDAPVDAPAAARALIEGHLVMLSRLAQIGMEIAEAAGAEARAAAATAATAPENGAAPTREHRADPGVTFARVARAVRLTIALQSRLLKDLADLDRAEERAARDRKLDRRIRLHRLVGQAAEAAVAARGDGDGEDWDEDALEDEIEQLSEDAYERLTEAEDGDLWGRSFDEVVAGVVKDLGLSPDAAARLMAATVPPADPAREPACASRRAPAPPPDPAPPPVRVCWIGADGAPRAPP